MTEEQLEKEAAIFEKVLEKFRGREMNAGTRREMVDACFAEIHKHVEIQTGVELDSTGLKFTAKAVRK